VLVGENRVHLGLGEKCSHLSVRRFSSSFQRPATWQGKWGHVWAGRGTIRWDENTASTGSLEQTGYRRRGESDHT
jgi:hypothetical protein